jgi:hypothetical protein
MMARLGSSFKLNFKLRRTPELESVSVPVLPQCGSVCRGSGLSFRLVDGLVRPRCAASLAGTGAVTDSDTGDVSSESRFK